MTDYDREHVCFASGLHLRGEQCQCTCEACANWKAADAKLRWRGVPNKATSFVPEQKNAFATTDDQDNQTRARVLLQRNALQSLARLAAAELVDGTPEASLEYARDYSRAVYDGLAAELDLSEDERMEGSSIYISAFAEELTRLRKDGAS